jgi:hypothetical protein
LKKIFFDRIIEEGKPTGFVDSDYDINELSDSKENIIISDEESEEDIEEQEESQVERVSRRIVESRTSILETQQKEKRRVQESSVIKESKSMKQSSPVRQSKNVVESRGKLKENKIKKRRNVSPEEIIYSGDSDAEHKFAFSKKYGGNFDSEEEYDPDFLSDEDSYSEDDFREEVKLNNKLADNIMKNQRLKSGLNSYGGKQKTSKASKHKFK